MNYKGFKITFKVDGKRCDVLASLREVYIPAFASAFPDDVEGQLDCALATLAQDLREGGLGGEIDWTICAVRSAT